MVRALRKRKDRRREVWRSWGWRLRGQALSTSSRAWILFLEQGEATGRFWVSE